MKIWEYIELNCYGNAFNKSEIYLAISSCCYIFMVSFCKYWDNEKASFRNLTLPILCPYTFILKANIHNTLPDEARFKNKLKYFLFIIENDA